ncbi:c-type cytochrome [Parvularcula sp. ZS-1/3]|uniref:C-type cytochrome n=1 Tax=Parvularcula mediterranea TaxID=2732508 RepID=A0A7Y3RNV9_9PROT|nr:c-type cytochrome [Parvularcula mediterranea]NNU17551.1 c-type cytochrome [Parvularcula mediterranea]
MKRALVFVVVLLGALSAFFVLRAAREIPEPERRISAEANGDSLMGRKLFVTKSCVTCHQVRGVGGRAGPPLDVIVGGESPTSADFLAGMWRGAPIMVELQRLEIGYQIDLEGDELLHLAAFASDPQAQDTFTIDDVPLQMQELFLDEAYVLEEDLDDFYDRYRGEEWYDFSDGPPHD